MIASPCPIGDTFGWLTVLAEGVRAHGKRRVIARCACGTTLLVWLDNLKSGHSSSCGCVRTALRAARVQHGHARNDQESVLYLLWCAIKARCYNPKHEHYQYDGGRGIGMWSGWAALFECFRDDILASIGAHPGKGWSLDRINNDLGYLPGNVRWATQVEQVRNSRPKRPRKHSDNHSDTTAVQ